MDSKSAAKLTPAATTSPSDEGTRTLRLESVQDLPWNRPQGERDVPSLTVLTGPSFGEFFTIAATDAIVGRSSSADVRIDDASISRRHARLRRTDLGFVIEDLGSCNGTYVNGEPVEGPTKLTEGDKITLGKLTILRFSFNDAFDQAFQKRLYDAALRDGLTHAFNKRYLLERIQMELSFARRHMTPLALVIMDVDHFKRINDTLGHQAGDKVLVELVQRLQRLIRQEDILGRYGGEEFVLVCRGIPAVHAPMVGERVRATVENHVFMYDDARVPVTVSVGVASFPEVDARTPEQIVGAADMALYRAKQTGRNRVCCC